jgi:predicted nucleic acid-binding protein
MQKRLDGRFSLKNKIYLDTTIISALFDKRTPERMSQTWQFWEHIDEYNVYISELVIDEIKGASQPLQDEMLKKVSNFTLLPVTDDVQYLAKEYIENEIFPEKYSADALHVALASINQIGILLSWNFTHLVKIKTRRMVALINAIHNYNPVEIIAPPEL